MESKSNQIFAIYCLKYIYFSKQDAKFIKFMKQDLVRAVDNHLIAHDIVWFYETQLFIKRLRKFTTEL
jgi:hypothetical protein